MINTAIMKCLATCLLLGLLATRPMAQACEWRKLTARLELLYAFNETEKGLAICDSIANDYRLAKKEEDACLLELIYSYTGSYHEKAGRYNKAAYYYQYAADKLQKMPGEAFRYAEAISNLGNLYSSGLELHTTGLPYLEKGRDIMRELGQTRSESFAAICNNLVVAYGQSGDYWRAEHYFDTTLALIDTLKLGYLKKATVCNNMASVYLRVGNLNKALSRYEEALRYLKRPGGQVPREGLETLGNILHVYQAKRDTASLQKIMREYGNDFEKTKTSHARLYGRYLYCKAYVHLLNLQFDSSRTCLDLATSYSTKNTIYNSSLFFSQQTALAQLLAYENKMDSALYVLNTLKDSVDIVQIDKDVQMSYYSLLLEIFFNSGNLAGVEDCLHRQKQLQDTILYNNYEYATPEDKLMMLEHAARIDKSYTTLLQMMQKPGQAMLHNAYNHHLTLKGIILDDEEVFMKNISQNNNINIKKEYNLLSNRKRELRQAITKDTLRYYANRVYIDSLYRETDKLRRDIQYKIRGYKKPPAMLKNGLAGLSTDSLLKVLNASECLIDIVISDYYSYAEQKNKSGYAAYIINGRDKSVHFRYLISYDSLQLIINETGKKEMKDQLVYMYRDIRLSDRQTVFASDKIYTQVFKKLEPFLRNVSTIYYSPDGLFNQISLDALTTPFNKYLLTEGYDIYHLSSARALLKLKAARPPSIKHVLITGGIRYTTSDTLCGSTQAQPAAKTLRAPGDFNRSDWPCLDGTLQEAAVLKKIVNSKNIAPTYLTGNNAREHDLKAALETPFDLIHIGTHTAIDLPNSKRLAQTHINPRVLLVSENPLMKIGLVMSGANNISSSGNAPKADNDGILDGYEISLCNLGGTRLVVLSACESGYGKMLGAEGVFGLQRAFKIAGVEKVLVSIWPLYDKHTPIFMNLFYQELFKTNNTSIHTAFRKTKIALSKKYGPAFWAGFELIE